MAEVRRNQRWIESTDPVTGQRIYTDEATGEVVTPDASGAPPMPAAPMTTQVSERTVNQQGAPTDGPMLGEPGAPPRYHSQETAVYTEDPFEHRRTQNLKLQQAIYLIFGIIEGLLAIRFVLRLLGANPNSGFAAAIYGITQPLMLPFANVFGTPRFDGSVVEFNAIVAIIVYALIAWVLVKLAWLVGGETRSGTRTSQVHRRMDQ